MVFGTASFHFTSSAVTERPILASEISSYPNPFPSRTQISFTASEAGYAEVSIVNNLGAEVARLYAGELGDGNHSFAWDASNFAPGTYWCLVRMNGQLQRIGLSLVR